jgi:hypothetical protein
MSKYRVVFVIDTDVFNENEICAKVLGQTAAEFREESNPEDPDDVVELCIVHEVFAECWETDVHVTDVTKVPEEKWFEPFRVV